MKSIGRVTKVHGKRGEVVVFSAHDLSSFLQSGMSVALVPPPLKLNRYRIIRSIKNVGQCYLISFDGIESINDASEFIGCNLLLEKNFLPDDFAITDHEHLIGRSVSDTNFDWLGTIVEIYSSSAQDTWLIEGPFGEIMIPAVPEFIQKFPNEGEIVVAVPATLVEGGK